MSKPPQRLYLPQPLAAGLLTLNKPRSHYLHTVLRLGQGADVLLFNEQSGEWRALISEPHKAACQLEIVQQTRACQPEADVWLLFAPIKKAPIDWLAQKATELGATGLWPVLTDRTIARRVNTERLQANVIEAAEQTGRLSLPQLLPVTSLEQALTQLPSSRWLLLADETGTAPPILEVLQQHRTYKPWAILIGPEGGFTPAELQIIRARPNTVGCSLGERLLRADTAALAALAVWQTVMG